MSSSWKSWTDSSSWEGQPWEKSSNQPIKPSRWGSHDQTYELPSNFVQDATHIDSNCVPHPNGLTFLREIESTPWSRKAGLAGRDVLDVKLHELAYHGVREQSLRHLSHGRFSSLVFCRSVAEAVLLNKFLQTMRTNSYDIDELAREAFVAAFPGKSVPDKREASGDYIQPIVDVLFAGLKHLQGKKEVAANTKELEELREKCRVLESQAQRVEVPTTPVPRSSINKSPIASQATSHNEVRDESPLPSSVRRQSSKAEAKAKPSSTRSRTPRGRVLVQPKLSFEKLVPKEPSTPPPGFEHLNHPMFKPKNDPLAVTSPSGPLPKQITAWVNEIIEGLSKGGQSELRTNLKEAELVWSRIATALRPDLGKLATQWGLPEKIASKAKPEGLLQIVAIASYLAA